MENMVMFITQDIFNAKQNLFMIFNIFNQIYSWPLPCIEYKQ